MQNSKPKYLSPKRFFLLALLALIFISLSQRAPISVLGPLATRVMAHFELSAKSFGALASLPVFAFAFFAAFAPLFGLYRSILAALLLLLSGLLLRGFLDTWTLFLGTALIGCGIAILNCAMPTFIKTKFKDVGFAMSLYSGILSLSSFFGIFGHHLVGLIGLQGSLSFWWLLVFIALIFYAPFTRNKRLKRKGAKGDFKGLFAMAKRLDAWKFCLFMAAQSCSYYTLIAWHSALCQSKLEDVNVSANLTLMMQGASIFSAYFIPLIYSRLKGSGAVFTQAVCLMYTTGFLLLIYAQNIWLIAALSLLISIPAGGTFGILLVLFAQKARDAQTLRYASNLALCAGYLLASLGPFIFGLLLDLTKTYTAGLCFMSALGFLLFIAARLVLGVRTL